MVSQSPEEDRRGAHGTHHGQPPRGAGKRDPLPPEAKGIGDSCVSRRPQDLEAGGGGAARLAAPGAACGGAWPAACCGLSGYEKLLALEKNYCVDRHRTVAVHRAFLSRHEIVQVDTGPVRAGRREPAQGVLFWVLFAHLFIYRAPGLRAQRPRDPRRRSPGWRQRQRQRLCLFVLNIGNKRFDHRRFCNRPPAPSVMLLPAPPPPPPGGRFLVHMNARLKNGPWPDHILSGQGSRASGRPPERKTEPAHAFGESSSGTPLMAVGQIAH